MQTMIEQLISEVHASVLTFHFDYINKTISPSHDLRSEQDQLMRVISYACTLTSDRIALVGKSLGGVIALHAASQCSVISQVVSITVLGWPMTLGNPPRLEMLSDQMAEPIDVLEEYRYLLTSIVMPIHVVQGGGDDLGSVSDCERAIHLCQQATLNVVPKADHGFCVKGEPVFLACADAMTSHLRQDFSL